MSRMVRAAALTIALAGAAFTGSAGVAAADAQGAAYDSPGTRSGHVLRLPGYAQVNLCGQSSTGLFTPWGSICVSRSGYDNAEHGHEGRGQEGNGHGEGGSHHGDESSGSGSHHDSEGGEGGEGGSHHGDKGGESGGSGSHHKSEGSDDESGWRDHEGEGDDSESREHGGNGGEDSDHGKW